MAIEIADAELVRAQIIKELLDFSSPLESIAQRLRALSWDYDGSHSVLLPAHIIAVLRRYLAGNISSTTVEDWANLLECRKDIDVSGGTDGRTGAILHELANPVLFEPLSPERAWNLINSFNEPA
jgi:hypothetical protein